MMIVIMIFSLIQIHHQSQPCDVRMKSTTNQPASSAQRPPSSKRLYIISIRLLPINTTTF